MVVIPQATCESVSDVGSVEIVYSFVVPVITREAVTV